MKKLILAGIAVLLVMFFVTCDDFAFNNAEEKVEYTDVVYSDDGSTVTLYLDGVGVPVTKAQRAITRDLAKMAYDYFEVIFIAKTDKTATVTTLASPVIARAQWELGQSAGISGVYRGDSTSKGADYLWTSGETNRVALMFVGRKDDKTLLGVGRIAEVDHSATTAPVAAAYAAAQASTTTTSNYPSTFVTGITSTDGLPNTPYAFILPTSTSVTFYVEAIKTGLLIGNEDDGTTTGNDIGAKTDSFQYTGTNAANADEDWPNRIGHSKRQSPASGSKSLYPIYFLPEEKGKVQHAHYAFKGAAVTFANEILYNTAPTKTGVLPDKGIAIERRFPRYLEGGRYRQLRENVDTDSTVVLDTVTSTYGSGPGQIIYGYDDVISAGDPLKPIIPLKFTTQGTGVFSFFIEIPVYMITKTLGTNNGDLQPITWKLRTGLGSELYSLDSGKSAGGCVLMGIGEIDLDWLEIYWQWLDE